MIVAMIVVWMMQVAVNEIVDVIPVWHLLMPASRPMHVSWIMAAAMVQRGAAVGIDPGDFDYMLVDAAVMYMLEVTIV